MEDLLSLPQPTSSNPSNNNDDIVVDGVPFITLHDKAQDFANVLNFIYNQSLPGAPAPYLNRQDLMGIIRFTGKYLMDSLRQWAVLQLEQVHLVLARDISSKSGLTHVIALQSREEHIRTIDFARECSLPQYLPLSFYALATQDGAGHRAPEGYRPSCGPPSPWPPLPHQTWGPPLPNQGWGLPPPPWLQPPSGPHPGPPSADIQLSQEDQRRVDEGRVALTKAVIQKAFGRQENLGSEERCAGSCRNGLPTMWQDAATRWEQLLLHPLEELDARSKIDYEHLCEECAYWVKVSSGTLRDELVKQLVIFFKLEDEVGSADDNDSYRGHDEYGPYDSDG
ncbi:hypothetical protein FRC01_012587 [Tulasnella sp. 417]|nr:hypothetical protein FRC01_012587 [Tulasnella sp. 417]